jgi:hypothetical protein
MPVGHGRETNGRAALWLGLTPPEDTVRTQGAVPGQRAPAILLGSRTQRTHTVGSVSDRHRAGWGE